MRNLFDPLLVEDTKRRILQLGLESERQWGSMGVVEALGHCISGIEMATGVLQAKRAPFPANLIGRLIKPLIFRDDKPMRRNSPSSPELFSAKAPQSEFDRERSRLITAMESFVSNGPTGCSRNPHPYFGPLEPDEWAILMYKHLDHHLRQFGV